LTSAVNRHANVGAPGGGADGGGARGGDGGDGGDGGGDGGGGVGAAMYTARSAAKLLSVPP